MTLKQQSPAKPAKKPSEPPSSDAALPNDKKLPPEYGGRKGPEATRYGDWEMNGKCVDF
jgi:hypothetical protein